MGSFIEKDAQGRLVLKPDALTRARQEAQARLRALDPQEVRSGARGQSLADLRVILADMLDLLRGDDA
jgi:hypothetical protein